MNKVSGKVSVVTGGSYGIGRYTSIRLAQEGASVAITDTQDEVGKKLVEKISNFNGKAHYWHLDVSQESAVETVFNQVQDKWGKIDVLVNSASILSPNMLTPKAGVLGKNSLLDITLNGMVFCTKYAIDAMIDNGGGSIINMTPFPASNMAEAPDSPTYQASRGAVRLMNQTDAMLYAEDNIRVNLVDAIPLSRAYLQSPSDPPENRQTRSQPSAAGHAESCISEAEKVTQGIIYLASDESKSITGAELIIDRD